MKSLILSFSALILLFASLNAQQSGKNKLFPEGTKWQTTDKAVYYSFSQSTAAYSDLINPTQLNDTVWDDPDFQVPVSFPFYLNGVLITTLYVSGTGGTLMAMSTSMTKWEFILPFANDLVDRGYNSGISQSPISYKVEGITGSRILKIEFKNAGSYNELMETETNLMYINFQIFLYEGTNKIEFHYGPNLINSPEVFYDNTIGPVLGVMTYVQGTPPTIENPHILLGTFSNPVFSTAPASPEDTTVYISGVPANGKVFTFSYLLSGVEENSNLNNSISVAPTVFEENINVSQTHDNFEKNIVISDITGKIVYQGILNSENTQINLGFLQRGMYFLSQSGMKNSIKLIKL